MSKSKNDAFRYQVGGSLPFDAPSYIQRQADDELFQSLLRGEFCYVLNSRQMGKSSLRVQIMHRLQAVGVCCAVIDITSIGTQQVTLEQWYASLAGSLVSAFKLSINLRSWWRERSHLSPLARLKEFLEQVLLTEIQHKVVIFIDEIDSVLELKFSVDDFFAFIRGCYDNRTDQPAYGRLTFVLLGVATPSDLISDHHQTPFNIGQAIELHSFTLNEARTLLHGLQTVVDHPQDFLNQILSWTGGQPFLTQKLCQLIVQQAQQWDGKATTPLPSSVHQFPSGASPSPVLWVDRLVHTHMIDHWQETDQPEHLRTIRDRLLSRESSAPRLLGLYQKLLQQGAIVADDSPEQMELRLSGLVVRRGDQLRVYNRIYQEVFNLAWVEHQLRKRRPYALALEAWVQSNRQDGSYLLQGQALKAAQAWAVDKSLSDVDYHFLGASQDQEQQAIQLKLKTERLQAVEAQLTQEQKTAQFQRWLLGAISVGFGVVSCLGLVSLLLYHKSLQDQVQLHIKSAEALLASGQQLDGVIEALRGVNQAYQFPIMAVNIRQAAESTLLRTALGAFEFNRLSGHGDGVLAVDISPDDQMIASASWDGTVKLWRRDGQLLHTLRDREGRIYDVAFHPNGQILVAAGSAPSIKLWSTDGTRLRLLRGHQSTVYGVAFSPDGTMIASASGDQTVKLWRLDGSLLRTLQGHGGKVYDVAFSSDGQVIASASDDQTIKLWRPDGTLLQTLTGHRGVVLSVAFSPDGQWIASGSGDNTVRLWSRTGTLLATFNGHRAAVTKVLFLPDSKTLISTSEDNSLQLLTTDGYVLGNFLGHRDGVLSVDVSSDGQWLASASWDNTVKLWQARRNKLLEQLYGHNDEIRGIAFTPDGTRLITGSPDRTLTLWDQNRELLNVIHGNTNGILTVLTAPGHGPLILSAGQDYGINLWRMTGEPVNTFVGHQDKVLALEVSPDGQAIASGSLDKTIKLWRPDGTLLHTLTGHGDGVLAVAFSPDGELIASASRDYTVRLWSRDGTWRKTLYAHEAEVRDVTFSPDGQIMASASRDQTIKLWTREGQLLKTLSGHDDRIWSVVFSPDGQLLASGGDDRTIKLWRRDGTLLKTLYVSDAIRALAFSPDGMVLVSGGRDNAITLWTMDHMLNLDGLKFACEQVQDYLNTNVNVDQSDRKVCRQLLSHISSVGSSSN